MTDLRLSSRLSFNDMNTESETGRRDHLTSRMDDKDDDVDDSVY
jgi:hypothetical protein